MIGKIDKQGLEEALRTNGKPIVVDFITDWCPYCKQLAPVLEEIAGEYINDIEVYTVNIEEHPDIAERYDVMTVPSVFIFRNGEIKGKAVNPWPKEALIQFIFQGGS